MNSFITNPFDPVFVNYSNRKSIVFDVNRAFMMIIKRVSLGFYSDSGNNAVVGYQLVFLPSAHLGPVS